MIGRYCSLQTHVRGCWIVIAENEGFSCNPLQPKLVQVLWVESLEGHNTWCGTGHDEQLGSRAAHTLPPKSHPSTGFLYHLICLNASRNHPWWERQPRQVWVSATPETAWAASPLINSRISARKSACVCPISGIHLRFTYCKHPPGKI